MSSEPIDAGLPDHASGRVDPHRSVRRRLLRLVMLTTGFALGMAGLAALVYDLAVFRASWAADLSNEAAILAISTAPALEFDDRRAAQSALAAMKIRPRVLVASLYTANGQLYASYVRDPREIPAPRPPPLGRHIEGEVAQLSQPLIHNGETLGTIYIRARYDLAGRIPAYLAIFGLVMVVSLGGAYAFANRLQQQIAEPLDAVREVARQVVDGHNYAIRAPALQDDEIGVVVRAFNRMLDEVAARTAALEGANASLQAEVTERLKAEAALREADRRKDEFLATLAHELRNPLAPIRHAVKILERDADDRTRHWGRQVIARQVHRMALLLDDLLDVSRITRGKLTLKRDVVSLESVVDAACEVARPLLDAKGQKLTVRLPGAAVRLYVDALRVSQSLSNLLTNAAKYTDQGGAIDLEVTANREGIVFSVRDSGIGLDPQSIPSLFKMFSQVEPGLERGEGGLGIGLALVKGLIDLHGGRVEASSSGMGQGSEFIVRLPRDALVDADEPAVVQSPQRGASAGIKSRILVVDDNRDGADSLGLILQLWGHDVVVAYSGATGLELARRHRPEVAILDIGLTDITGYELARRIRLEDWGRDIVLIALTGWGHGADKARAAAAGFDVHLTKPVDPDHLQALLQDPRVS